ncbi:MULTISPECIES: c-type cytochrome [Thiomicrorhabdus]|uniref:Cytochrome c n=1 Tax=Thiomicrorhabdus heinhorstiae TaxID=2748010 RepID=A0ABS0BZ70_9GAMM|nr:MULTISPECIES: cytochrome c [Thiomicrorhabdus]MBF6059095.1 cytochrome c [Thiomicrorhabdus heinhorstiae]
MKKIIIATLSASALFAASFGAQAAPAKAATCVGCHGADGNSVVPNFPKLAGQHANYLEKQLKDFRDGFRKDATMAAFAKGLTDAEIKELAAFYASQAPK